MGSITDVITNSSTEVFTVYSDNGIDFIKRMVNNILSLKGGNDLKFDDLFNVRYNFELDYIVESGDGEDNLYVVPELSDSEIKEWINLGDDDDKKKDFLLNLPYEKLLNICTAYEDDEYERRYDPGLRPSLRPAPGSDGAGPHRGGRGREPGGHSGGDRRRD